MINHFNFNIYSLPLSFESDDKFGDMDGAMLGNNTSGVWVRKEDEGIVEVDTRMEADKDSRVGEEKYTVTKE